MKINGIKIDATEPIGLKIDTLDFKRIRNAGAGNIMLHNRGYAFFRIDKKGYQVHRFIMDAPKDKEVDHINGNKLDNRRCNLRFCTTSENGRNRRLQSNNTSGYPGVGTYKGWKSWGACIRHRGKLIQLGKFPTMHDAILARRAAEIEYFGEYRQKKISLKIWRLLK